ncbi:A disintegrin and metalloproteinase with thrombospondin motifs 16 [Drosophila serrata]|uniref:A disintegrin and metalloproteinase with thrombospondin motifs 16 n=1 Tax=Drosophila serrata TaxID=7274 RepID=UPI000A1D1AC5|nr:A disintegrin and metalloproteinase with thrombospondin motifs 16 [Drosophila serrata]
MSAAASAIGSNRHCRLALIVLTTLWLLIDVDATASASATRPKSVNIELRRKRSLHYNGIELDENAVLGELREHERALIFGSRSGEEALNFKLVHLAQQEENPQEENPIEDLKEGNPPRRRQRRSLPAEQQDDDDDDDDSKAVEARLQLHQSPQLIDDAFIFIRRTENGTQFVDHSPQLLKRLEQCFYRSPAAALDLCEPGSVRGVFQQNASDFVIQPLPSRFGTGTHVLYEARVDRGGSGGGVSSRRINDGTPQPLNSQLQFEPDAEEFNEPRRRLRAQSPLRLRFQPRHHHTHHNHHHSQPRHRRRTRRYIGNPPRSRWSDIPDELFIETAIFVDSDLYEHMQRNFPTDTDGKVISFVMAMINGVQLLYHHPTLGRRINFVLKRLEIWKPREPQGLSRSRDVDKYLNTFCKWQEKMNPYSDADPLHYDHALVLTGMDLVTFENGKANSQVVGMATVNGMCTSIYSCTINEAKHFESVFVVAHEIGHNLGMRHDAKEISCDPTMHIMSPKLGSGKVTWSKCSRTYLEDFLLDPQAECLFDRGQFVANLDHSAGGILPGERFNANQQCMLRFGKDFKQASSQNKMEICRDLHCRQDGLPWTSHPALEGTECGDNMWCRGGTCEARSRKSWTHENVAEPTHEKIIRHDSNRIPSLLHEYNPMGNELPGSPSNWGEWSEPSACESGCLYGQSHRLLEGSTGLRTFNRSCLNYPARCMGRDLRFVTCPSAQCHKVPLQTIGDFATKVCLQARKSDPELTGEGQQLSTTLEESCKIFCRTRSNGTKSRRWIFPDGTSCRSKQHKPEDITYCIGGRCERFSCDNSTTNFFKMDNDFCERKSGRPVRDSSDQESRQETTNKRYAERQQGITPRSPHENEVAKGIPRGNHISAPPAPYKRRPYPKPYPPEISRPPPPASASLIAIDRSSSPESEWVVHPGCHSNCMTDSKGVQGVTSRLTGVESIRLCSYRVQPCERLQTATEFAEQTCARYRSKVRGLSGRGAQIWPSIDEPDRSCRVGCQDEYIKYRYYLVNGRNGQFPLGTRCSQVGKRYCVYGRCLEFGDDDLPLEKTHISLGRLRSRRRRSMAFNELVNITQNLEETHLDISDVNNELTQPIHVSADELSSNSQ